jgi:hypothetical protein
VAHLVSIDKQTQESLEANRQQTELFAVFMQNVDQGFICIVEDPALAAHTPPPDERRVLRLPPVQSIPVPRPPSRAVGPPRSRSDDEGRGELAAKTWLGRRLSSLPELSKLVRKTLPGTFRRFSSSLIGL